MARILIAEHNLTTSAYLMSTLKKAGHQVEHADNCLDAWRASASAEHDVMLVNVVMPGIDSFVLAQRAMQDNPHLQIIFITGFAGVAMDSFTQPTYLPISTRPFHLKEIAARVRYVLGQGNLPMTLHTQAAPGHVIYADFASKQANM